MPLSRQPLRVVSFAIAIPACLCALTPATAGEPRKAGESVHLDALLACRAESDPTARLACFDQATSQMSAAIEKGDMRVVDREDVRKARRSLFGFALPTLNIFGKGDRDEDKAEELEKVDTTVASVTRRGSSMFVKTAEGAMWEVYDVPRRLMTPKAGESLEIRKGALTAYFLRFGKQPGVKGRRVE